MNNPNKYKLRDDGFIVDTETNSTIPSRESNKDYRDYLEWTKNNTTQDLEDLNSVVSSVINKINIECSRLRIQLISELSNTLEYFMLLQDVNTFKNNNYTGDVPRSISFYSTLYNKTEKETCDIYLLKYSKVYNIIMSLREKRLTFLKQVKLLQNKDQVNSLYMQTINDLEAILPTINEVILDDS